MKKILLCFGTRPEAVKMCPLVKELESRPDFNVKVCVTGQHRELLYPVLALFGVKPDYDCRVMTEGQTPAETAARILTAVTDVLKAEHPDFVLVHGDTTTSFASALACFYLGIPLGHVEAGLRSDDILSPFPEEFDRRAVSLISSYDFCPTPENKMVLISEGKPENRAFVTGNTVIDALMTTSSSFTGSVLSEWASDSRLILMTAHRRESFGEPLKNVFRALRRAVSERPDVKVIYPVHPNPEVMKAASELDGIGRVRLTPPLELTEFHSLMSECFIVMTDSGGIQEEAPYFHKPVIVTRDTTERPEGVRAGTLLLCGTNEEKVYSALASLLDGDKIYGKMASAVNPYGDGKASSRIADILESVI